jgi:hypothetical protein
LASSKLCTPSDRRVTPAARKAANLPASAVPGLASSVISASGCSGRRMRIAASSASAVAADIRLGVPPPMKTLPTGRFQTCGSAASRSAIRAARYAASSVSPRGSCELKSQYGHLRTHHGQCT